jgi:phage N-6-adenine-methyltransferase
LVDVALLPESSMNPALFSSATDLWSTPQDFFDKLDAEFNFVLDVCATPANAKTEHFYSTDQNGLQQAWAADLAEFQLNGAVWMNSPYGDPEYPCKKVCTKKRCVKRGYHCTQYVPGIIDWMTKAHNESLNGATVVCLVPSRTDNEWWHRFVMPRLDGRLPGEVRFIPGRLKFGGSRNSAPFPSAVVVMRPPVTQ